MKTIMYAPCALLAATLWLTGCSEDSADPDPCASRSISLTASITDAHQGESDGSIMASASGSSGFMFRLNGGSYQPSSTFGSLAAGTYTITVKDKDDCTISQDFTVDELSPATVSYSARIKPIIETVCWNCHKQAGQPGFPHADLSTDEKVKANAARINTEVQAGRMPKGGTLSADQKADIAAWVAAGAPINN